MSWREQVEYQLRDAEQRLAEARAAAVRDVRLRGNVQEQHERAVANAERRVRTLRSIVHGAVQQEEDDDWSPIPDEEDCP